MPTEHPCIGFFLALPLKAPLTLGDWVVGTPPQETPWRSLRFRELVGMLVASLNVPEVRGGAMLWHRERGFDGVPPTKDERAAIRAAVSFAAFDANDHLGRYEKPDCLTTTENTALYVQPIDENNGSITHVEDGALRSTLVGGWKVGDRPLALPDAVFPITSPVQASAKLARAVFEVHASARPGTDSARLAVALEWHRVAMANAPAVSLAQRLIALKTGFEALLGSSNSWECARQLRALFEDATRAHRDLLPWAGVLWSPNERGDLPRQYQRRDGRQQVSTRSELEDWFMTLAEARNSVIHDGILAATEYGPPPERPLSRYSGPLFWVGERLLREAVKAKLGAEVLLCGRIAEWATFEPLLQALAEQARDSAPPGDQAAAAPQEESSAAPRDLPALLSTIGCDAANRVLLSRLPGTWSTGSGGAAERTGTVQEHWKAVAGSRSMLITTAERDILKGAGAEEELPDDWTACE